MKVLIVEDESIIALAYQIDLEKRGYSVVGICSSAEDALERLGQESPDAIILDIYLEGDMNGIDFARQLRRRKGQEKIIFITGNFDHQILEEAKSCEPTGFMVKPVDFEEVGRLLSTAV